VRALRRQHCGGAAARGGIHHLGDALRTAADEKAYWHPHNYEILSGTLRMPGLPAAAERAALRRKVNSYGKAHPEMTAARDQGGVLAIAEAFPQRVPLQGVRDDGNAATRAVPMLILRQPPR
jgi:hypothetical protein